MTKYFRTVPCPGAEFGLEPCEEEIRQRATQQPDGLMQPGDWVEEEDLEPPCGCDTKVPANKISEYWDRVWEELEKKDWEFDYRGW